jgi:energy-coupling factor transporter transmembrane protein EcfT
MFYGFITILLLIVVFCFLMIKRLSKEKRNKFFKYAGIFLAVIIIIIFIFNMGYYYGFEQSRQMLKSEQALVLDISEKAFLDNNDLNELMTFLFESKAFALISNIEYDHEPFYAKIISQHCLKLFQYDDAMSRHAASRLIRLCANIDKYNIDKETKKLINMRLDVLIKPKYQSQIDSFIKNNEPKEEKDTGSFKSLFK